MRTLRTEVRRLQQELHLARQQNAKLVAAYVEKRRELRQQQVGGHPWIVEAHAAHGKAAKHTTTQPVRAASAIAALHTFRSAAAGSCGWGYTVSQAL